MPWLKPIAISTELTDAMRLRRPEFDVKVAEDENLQVKYPQCLF
jgi:hypothetical protein